MHKLIKSLIHSKNLRHAHAERDYLDIERTNRLRGLVCQDKTDVVPVWHLLDALYKRELAASARQIEVVDNQEKSEIRRCHPCRWRISWSRSTSEESGGATRIPTPDLWGTESGGMIWFFSWIDLMTHLSLPMSSSPCCNSHCLETLCIEET